MLDRAFRGEDWQGVLRNLQGLEEEELDWLAPGAGRSIRHNVEHLGGAKLMYENHAFGDGTLQWSPSLVRQSDVAKGSTESVGGLLEWLEAAHETFGRRVAELSDDDLVTIRRMSWGEKWNTRRIIAVMIEHDLHHAGEINHIRALRRGEERPGLVVRPSRSPGLR